MKKLSLLLALWMITGVAWAEQQVLNDGETFGAIRGKINSNFTEVYETRPAALPGTAAYLDYGVAIGDLLQIEDDGSGNPVISISGVDVPTGADYTVGGTALDIGDLTDTGGLLGASSLSGLSDWPAGVSATEVGHLDGATDNIQAQINNINTVSGYVATPTYSNELCTTGQWSFDASYHYICKATNQWDRYSITFAGWDNPGGCTGTIGNEVEGTTANTFYTGIAVGDVYAVRLPVSCSGTLAAVSIFGQYFTNTSAEGRFLIYSDNGSGSSPDSLLHDLGVTNGGAQGPLWFGLSSLSSAISGEPEYIWVAVQIENNSSYLHRSTSGGTVYPFRAIHGTWGSPPSSWGTSFYSNDTWAPLINITFE